VGMFDNVYLIDPSVRERCVCASGHVPDETTVFQTKDRECLMDDYFVVDNELRLRSGSWLVDETMPPPPEGHGEFDRYTGQLRIYSSCKSCPETLWEFKDRKSPFGPQRKAPWMEFVLLFHFGRLVVVEPVELETVEQVREKMTKLGRTEVK